MDRDTNDSTSTVASFETVARWCDEYFVSARGSGTPLGPQIVRLIRAFGEMAAAETSDTATRALRLSMIREKTEAYLQGFMRGDLAGVSNQSLPEPSKRVQLEAMAHVQDNGDTDWRPQLTEIGLSGFHKRIEGFAVRVQPPIEGISIRYKAHVAMRGDTRWVGDGEYCGTRGDKLRVEAIWIELAEGFDRYDVYYSAHLCRFGWTGWFKNGQMCGTRGEYRQVEAIKVFLVEKT